MPQSAVIYPLGPDVSLHQLDPVAHPKNVKRVAAAGAAQTLDLSLFDTWDFTLTANITLTVTNPPGVPNFNEYKLILRQDATGSRLGTFPASMLFSGAAKTLTTTASGIDIVTFRPDPLVAAQFLCELVKAYA